ncbi:AT-hook motif nuclear-localized protein 9 [Hibiscus syriacus]|uniref:AT-hook motif nuclear-localized protein n=1 Tax=Hibiscus syriacus TaxID=106335 RepID=A0A6A2ZPR9_HIBSY|nr:AT-hook motif nuclear-localized protein 9-like [Hibiscus syriacus]KAE8693803.1 AT-hook motif nuclear-localized protein 9 [Hibiscus syriacus]
MDRRDAMALSGSYYMQQRGITGSGSGTQTGVHGSPGIHPLSNSNVQYQSSINATTMGANLPVEPMSGMTPHSVNVDTPPTVPPSETVKRKRGRPRKYGPDGAVSLALTPSSASHPGTITPTQKRGRGRPRGTGRKQQLSSLGELLAGSDGTCFTPHVITIAIGEDIATKLMSFSQQGSREVCILSANGAISTVALLQPSSLGGTVTYKGRFEILCLSGSYLLTSNGDSCNRTGGLSVSLASPDGHVIGGGVGGMLIAASPVQVIVGSFIRGGSKAKNKKGGSQDGLKDSDDQIVDNLVAPTGISPNHNPTPSLVAGVWPGARSMDMCSNSHIDIDLMRG